MNVDKKLVGENITKIRNKLDLTVIEFSKLPEINTQTGNIYKWERGKAVPRKNKLEIIAKLGGVTVDELVYGNQDNDIDKILRLYERLSEENKEKCMQLLNGVSKKIYALYLDDDYIADGTLEEISSFTEIDKDELKKHLNKRYSRGKGYTLVDLTED